MKYSLSALLFALLVAVAPMPAFAAISVSINIAPPELPIYEQPMLPGDGYIWTPGYWAYDDDDGDYYWVPGTWVLPPRVGFLWTPGYWIWSDNFYIFHYGYWGRRVGYYGGVNYGYGYGGYGYDGGRWDRGRFSYNRSANNINVTNIHNTYTRTVINNVDANRASYNGGDGGTRARPSSEERTSERQRHVAATPEQTRHEQTARAKPELRQSANHGRPPITATSKPAQFEDHGGAPARADDGNRERENARQVQMPAAAPRSEPIKNTDAAEARANARANVNMRREQREQPVQQPKPDVRVQPEARPQQQFPRQPRPEQQRQQQQQRQPTQQTGPEVPVQPRTRPQQQQSRQSQPELRRQQLPTQQPQSDAQPEQQRERPQQEERPQRQEKGRQQQRERPNQRE